MQDLIEKRFTIIAGSIALTLYKGMRGVILRVQDMGPDYSNSKRVTLAFPWRTINLYARHNPVDGVLRLNDGGPNSIRIRLQ